MVRGSERDASKQDEPLLFALYLHCADTNDLDNNNCAAPDKADDGGQL